MKKNRGHLDSNEKRILRRLSVTGIAILSFVTLSVFIAKANGSFVWL